MTFESDEELTAAEKQRVERVQRRQEEAVQKYEEEEERRMDERQVCLVSDYAQFFLLNLAPV